MKILEDLLASVSTEARADEVVIGPFLTAVASGAVGGLATTLLPRGPRAREPLLSESGSYAGRPLAELARLVLSTQPLEAGLGLAALNAALSREKGPWREQDGLDYLLAQAEDRNLALVGHFSFAHKLAPVARQCQILELEPEVGDLPTEAAERVIRDSDLVVITGSTFTNHTIAGLLQLAKGKLVFVLGPSAPLSPVLFDHGVTAIGGTLVTYVPRALQQVKEGAVFRQLQGVRRVILEKP